ncbi:MAG: NADH-quinone oxidoreductase subunit NuoG, partial [Desulfosalsimonadaceae bacterium]|nr:NADH-quinone oxidoreductase subunit NuoG [Desulfosalsimonadaceae bacterium]
MEIKGTETEVMVTIFIEGRPYQTQKGQNLLHACLSLGFDVPYFCWHPAFGSVGACRQCAVKRFRDEKDTRGEIVMSCMTPVTEGLRISIHDPEVIEFRAAIIEFLMLHHPHDCPICDEGGECHLQDMTVMTGHNYRSYRFPKRTHHNQNLGPFINHEMNRCIQCYRCVRFYRNFAGGRDLNVFSCHDHVYFGRYPEGPLENEFSGNLVEICPTGVFTDKTQKAHNTRIWDLQTAPSICVHCGLGCNTLPGERYGTLRRVRNRYHHDINGYFLCDRGRFGYEFVNSEGRIRKTFARTGRDAPLAEVPETDLISNAASAIADGNRVIGIGSPRASLEANFALRELVGAERFFVGLSDKDFNLLNLGCKILTEGPARSPSLRDAMFADAVLVMGEDVTQTAPLLALSLRQMQYQKAVKMAEQVHLPEWDDAGIREFAQDEKPALFIAAPYPTKLDDAAFSTFQAAPDELVCLGTAIRSMLAPDALLKTGIPDVPGLSDAGFAMAAEIAKALGQAKRPMIVTGTACGSAALIQSAANIAWTLCKQGLPATFSFCVPECNSMGLALMDAKDLLSAFQMVNENAADTVIVLENDLYRRADRSIVDAFLSKARQVIVIDHLTTDTVAKADMVFPAATFAESSGAYVNNEGRAQRFYSVFPPVPPIMESWRWIKEIMSAAGLDRGQDWGCLDDIAADLAKTLPAFGGVADLNSQAIMPFNVKIPRQPHRYSGRTSTSANINVSEPGPPQDPDSPLAFSMEGYDGKPPAALISRYWSPGWNSVQALNKFQQEVGGPMRGGSMRGGDPGVRLLQPSGRPAVPFFGPMPPGIQPGMPIDDSQRLLVPVHHI